MLAAERPARLAHLEPYLFGEVGPHFRATGIIAPEDFWLILIWKANRAKNHERRRFEKRGNCGFGEAVDRIAAALTEAKGLNERLGVLMKTWGMKLPTASAILTVLYPESFTVYDIRVCKQLGRFEEIAKRNFSETLWDDYRRFVAAVELAAPLNLTLREKDHYLWGLSLRDEVEADLKAPAPALKPRKASPEI